MSPLSSNQISLTAERQKQIPISPHQTEGMDLPIRLDASFAQGFKETLPVGVIAEDRFAPIPAIQDVVNRPFVFNAQRSWHGVTTQKPSICVNGED